MKQNDEQTVAKNIWVKDHLISALNEAVNKKK